MWFSSWFPVFRMVLCFRSFQSRISKALKVFFSKLQMLNLTWRGSQMSMPIFGGIAVWLNGSVFSQFRILFSSWNMTQFYRNWEFLFPCSNPCLTAWDDLSFTSPKDHSSFYLFVNWRRHRSFANRNRIAESFCQTLWNGILRTLMEVANEHISVCEKWFSYQPDCWNIFWWRLFRIP